MVDKVAEEITDPAGENQKDSSDNSDVSSLADDTTLLEEKDADNATAEAKDADGDDADGKAEPVNYDALEMPKDMEIDKASLGEFKDIAAEMNDGKGISVEDAQKLVDLRAKMVKASSSEWETRFSEWRGELLSDKELGGDNFKKVTVPNVLAAAERYGDKEMMELLQTNKMYGENPALVRMLNRVGETLRADQLVRGRAAEPGDEEARLRRMYPSHYNDDGSTKERHKGSSS